MRRICKGVECSQFTPGAYWVYGTEYYGFDVEIEYPDDLDILDDDDLLEMADDDFYEEQQRVKYV